MQNKYLHWFNLAACLPVALLQVLTLVPLLNNSTEVFVLTGECACGCAPAAGQTCCCNCSANEQGEGPLDLEGSVFPTGEANRFFSPSRCNPGSKGQIMPAPLPDHLAACFLPFSPTQEPPGHHRDHCAVFTGRWPDNPDKVPI